MSNIFLEYMSKQIKKEEVKEFKPGPVITISREYGCYGTEVAKLLCKEINKISPNPWNYVTKEILEESAKNLKVSELDIADLFGAEEKGFLGNIVVSFASKKYKSDSFVKSTIYSIVRKYCEQGNVIMVGRAGCSIARDIKKALHVRIVAPFDYRVEVIQKRFNLSKDEATEKVKVTDRNRKRFLSFFKENRTDEQIFDMILNRSKMTAEEMSAAVFGAAKERNLI